MAKTGLKDKSGATEASPDETDQAAKMKARSEGPAEEKAAGKAEEPESSLKDKGGEAEGGEITRQQNPFFPKGRRQQQSRQNRDDRNNHEQLDQSTRADF